MCQYLPARSSFGASWCGWLQHWEGLQRRGIDNLPGVLSSATVAAVALSAHGGPADPEGPPD